MYHTETIIIIFCNQCSLVIFSLFGQNILPLYWLWPVSGVQNCPHFLHVFAFTVRLYDRLVGVAVSFAGGSEEIAPGLMVENGAGQGNSNI